MRYVSNGVSLTGVLRDTHAIGRRSHVGNNVELTYYVRMCVITIGGGHVASFPTGRPVRERVKFQCLTERKAKAARETCMRYVDLRLAIFAFSSAMGMS